MATRNSLRMLSFMCHNAFHPGCSLIYSLQPWTFGLPRGWSGKVRQRPRDTPGLWDSLETPGEVAKLAPRGERLTGDAGSKVHHDDARELGLKASVRMGLGSTPPRCMSKFKACVFQTDRNKGKT
jgi:hypothetical protein